MNIDSARSTRTIALIIALINILAYIFAPLDAHALAPSSSFLSAFCYQFTHASIFHLACNMWSFLLIGFFWRITATEILLAYAISIIFGLAVIFGVIIPSKPIIGFSSFIYAIAGLRSLIHLTYSSQRPVLLCLRYNVIMLLTIFLTALIPAVSFLCHISCYLLGSIISIFITPIYKNKRT